MDRIPGNDVIVGLGVGDGQLDAPWTRPLERIVGRWMVN